MHMKIGDPSSMDHEEEEAAGAEDETWLRGYSKAASAGRIGTNYSTLDQASDAAAIVSTTTDQAMATTTSDHNQNKNHSSTNHDDDNDFPPIEAHEEEELLAERNNILIQLQSHNNSSTTSYSVLPQIGSHQPLLFPDHVDYNHFAQCQEFINVMNDVEHNNNNKKHRQRQVITTNAVQQQQMASSEQGQQQLQQQQGRSPYRTEMQRESHILAERQRREEMNEKFTILRSLLPKLTKKDKASIVTDTINYIRELEKKVASLEACRNKRKANHTHSHTGPTPHKGFDGSISQDKGNSQILNLRPQREHPLIPVKQDGQDSNLPLSNFHEDHSRRVKVGQVEIEDLGTNAVIKVLTTRTRGLVLRLHLALEDCKVEVIQSNVTTVGDNMVHFVTVGLNVGTSATLVELATTLQLAITQPMNIVI